MAPKIDTPENLVMSSSLFRLASGTLVVFAGIILGFGGYIVHSIRSAFSVQERIQATNGRVTDALNVLSGVGTAYADAPASCSSCGPGGSCVSCGCGE